MKPLRAVSDAVRLALATGVAVTAGSPGTSLAQEREDPALQEKVTVTGSRIKQVDIEGPSPVSIITRDDIDATGDISVAEVLRGSVWNTFGSYKQRSGSTAQSQSTVSLRGLGPERTLVLLDGRRMAGSPTVFAGAAQNLNVIPLAAVERIEVLREGASAIYGSDAIGGVVNIILRRDYEGMTLSWGIGRPTQTGGDEDSYSVVGGISSSKGNITFGFDVERKEIIYNGDRSYSEVGLSAFGFPGNYFAYLTTEDPRNPTGAFLSAGIFPDPRCPAELGASEEFPDSVFERGFCRYNFAGVAATEAENDTKSLFLNANYDLTDTTNFFARGNFSFNESYGRYAAAPFISDVGTPFMGQDNPNNPTNPANATNIEGQPFGGQSVTLADGTVVEGPFDLSLFYRNVPAGYRDTNIEDVLVDYLVGVEGLIDLWGGMDWSIAGQWSQQTSNSASPGLAIVPFFQQAVNDGSLDLFAANGPTDEGPQEAATFDGIYDARTRIASVDGNVGWDLLQMRNGPVPVALGFEYRDEYFEQNYDAQQNANRVAGSAGGVDTSGARVVKSLFAEANIPVLSRLDATVALRYDEYNDFGTTVTPQAKLAFRPLDSLLLRASWGKGFRAPDMSELYGPQDLGLPFVLDRYRCSLDPAVDTDGDGFPNVDPDTLPGAHPCTENQVPAVTGGNPELDPEKSEQWNAGFVWSPLDDLSVSLDYYNIELDDESIEPDGQLLFDQEFLLRQQGATGTNVGSITRNPRNNFVLRADQRLKTIGARETDGLDLEARYAFSLGAIGDFRTHLLWTHVLEYERDYGDGLGLRSLLGDFDPENRASLSVDWTLGDFSANATVNYMDEADNGFPDDRFLSELDSYTTVDVSFAYSTPWNGTITLGARNVFDEDPPTSANLGNPFYSNYLHDVYGRVPYVRYEQDL